MTHFNLTRDEFNAVWHTLTDKIAILDQIEKTADEKRHRIKAGIDKRNLQTALAKIEAQHKAPAPTGGEFDGTLDHQEYCRQHPERGDA